MAFRAYWLKLSGVVLNIGAINLCKEKGFYFPAAYAAFHGITEKYIIYIVFDSSMARQGNTAKRKTANIYSHKAKYAVKESIAGSRRAGRLAKGCSLCVRGRKSVLFITGICPRKCFYCPLSDNKKDRDVIYINERKVSNIRQVIEEIKLSCSFGVGITGGDPLSRISRTTTYIRTLKKEFGKGFHIHLYTSLDLVNKEALSRLYRAGLDEIRFHPDFDKPQQWPRLLLAKEFNWSVGVEIPVIPGTKRKTKRLIEFIKGKADFLNLNELEISDNNANKLLSYGFKPKDSISYAVLGSDRLAKELIAYSSRFIRTHYCTAKLKDSVQMAKRIKLRAKSVKKSFDYLTREGMLIRGAVYGTGKCLKQAYALIKKHESDAVLDTKRKRVLASVDIIDKLKAELRKINCRPAIVEDYPTYDSMNIETIFI